MNSKAQGSTPCERTNSFLFQPFGNLSPDLRTLCRTNVGLVQDSREKLTSDEPKSDFILFLVSCVPGDLSIME